VRRDDDGQPEAAAESRPSGSPETEEEADTTAAPEDAASQGGEDEQPAEDERSKTERERDEYLELAQRTRADFDNYRKRVAKDTADAAIRGKAELARELIPVVDNLERALAARPEAAEDDPLVKGVQLVHRELHATLARAGLEAYDPTGEKFDPSWHEAVSTQPGGEGQEPGHVLETIDRGYRIDGRVLRPARVVVSE
jgi:molecular chaperone GrpE